AGSRSGRRAVSPASPGRSLMELALIVNDERYTVDVPVGTTLLSVLRDDLRFTGTKEACVEGECGACTVLVDGQPIDACIYFAHAAQGRPVTTVEGLAAADGTLSELQR